MTTYKTYQEAKIANPESVIYEFEGYFSLLKSLGSKECNPADYCMTVEKFLASDHKFVYGDYLLTDNITKVMRVGMEDDRLGMSAYACNKPDDKVDSWTLVLRAAALENQMNIDKVETQAEHQEEMSAIGGEWKNGDVCIYKGREHRFIGVNPFDVGYALISSGLHDVVFGVKVNHLHTPENKQQREDRERLEAAYDLFITTYPGGCTFNEFKAGDIDSINKWLAIVDKTNYRKEAK